MRGDYADITYRTGAGTEKQRIQARSAGGVVSVAMPERNGLFVTVEELNKAGRPVQTARFAAGEVVAIVEGNAPVGGPKAKK